MINQYTKHYHTKQNYRHIPRLCDGQIILSQSRPGQPQDQRKNACDKKGRGTRKKGEISDHIGRGEEKIE